MNIKIIEEIMKIPAVAGNERLLKEYIKNKAGKFADSVYEDNFGNLICVKGSGGKKIMYNASISTEGLFVTDVKDNGVVKFSPIGQIEPDAHNLRKYTDEKGRIGVLFSDKEEKPSIPDMSVDFFGCKDIKNGDVLSPVCEYYSDGKTITGFSAGRGAAIYILLSLMEKLKSKGKTLYFVFSVQDNLGFKGAGIAANGTEPDAAYIIGRADCGNKLTEIKAGGGPVLRIMDKNVIFDKNLRDTLTAELKPCEYQYEILSSKADTNNRILYLGKGIPALNINCPVKFINSFCETVYISDINSIINLF